MSEMVNPRLISKITRSKFDKKVKEFLIEAIREEFKYIEQVRWNNSEFYRSLLEKYTLAGTGEAEE
jgi:hypothetical protein